MRLLYIQFGFKNSLHCCGSPCWEYKTLEIPQINQRESSYVIRKDFVLERQKGGKKKEKNFKKKRQNKINLSRATGIFCHDTYVNCIAPDQ